jgi:hypothetical protein
MGIYFLREKRKKKKPKHLKPKLNFFIKMKQILNLINQFEDSIVQKKND